jgi:metal-responsive CopG/Arc/MetJ family transcriptional regulator
VIVSFDAPEELLQRMDVMIAKQMLESVKDGERTTPRARSQFIRTAILFYLNYSNGNRNPKT